MARGEAKKPNFPSKPCPKCGKIIPARSKSHEACGWVESSSAATAPKKIGRPKGKRAAHAHTTNAVNVSIEDIRAVKDLAERLGVDKLRQLAEVLAT